MAQYLGRGLAILVDILNPEKIIIGSIFLRRRPLLEPLMLETLQREALSLSVSACQIVPPGLEMVGDYASLSVAKYYLRGSSMLKLGINCGSRPVLTITKGQGTASGCPGTPSSAVCGGKGRRRWGRVPLAADGVEVRLILKYLDDVTLGWIEASIAQEGEGFHRQKGSTATSAYRGIC